MAWVSCSARSSTSAWLMLSLVTTTRRKLAWDVTTVPYPRACSLTVLPAVVSSAAVASEEDARVRSAVARRGGSGRGDAHARGPAA